MVTMTNNNDGMDNTSSTLSKRRGKDGSNGEDNGGGKEIDQNCDRGAKSDDLTGKSDNIGTKSNEKQETLHDPDSTPTSELAPGLRRTSSTHSVSFVDLTRLLLVPEFDFGSGFLEMSDLTFKKINDMKNNTKDTLRKFKDENTSFASRKLTSQDVARFLASLNRRLSRFDERVQRSLQSSATEKAFYAAAVTLVAAGGFIIGKYPTYFPVFHTILFCALMPIRFYTYFKQSFQYYLADLCYYVNILLLLFLWVFPSSKSLFVSVFSLTLGTLCFAVITWRNSLVLHSIDKTTSSLIHFMPPITIFVLVHEVPKEYIAENYPAIGQVESWNFVNGIIVTSIYYTIWQVSYHYFITVRRREQIAKGRVTSFTYLKKKNSKTFLGRIVNGLPYTWMQVGAFSLIQFFYQILTMLPCPLWFRYKHLCGAFLIFIFAWSAYNGATYYVEVFGKRFEKEVATLKAEINELQQRISRHEAEKSTPSFSPVLEPLPSEPMEELRLLREGQ